MRRMRYMSLQFCKWDDTMLKDGRKWFLNMVNLAPNMAECVMAVRWVSCDGVFVELVQHRLPASQECAN
jgi:hypothetical protein